MTRPSRRALSEADRTAWAEVARTFRPLPGRAALPDMIPPAPLPRPHGAPADVAAPPPPARAAPPAPVSIGDVPGGLDRGSWRRLQTGRLSPQRRLDLHGRTAEGAYRALHGFLQQAHKDRVRCVEVITGRGSGEGGGVIRRELPVWLNLPALRPLVLAAVHPHPANPGAVRLLLRRAR